MNCQLGSCVLIRPWDRPGHGDWPTRKLCLSFAPDHHLSDKDCRGRRLTHFWILAMAPKRRRDHCDSSTSKFTTTAQTQNAASTPSLDAAQSISSQPAGSDSTSEKQSVTRRTRSTCPTNELSSASRSGTAETSTDRVDGASGSSKGT